MAVKITGATVAALEQLAMQAVEGPWYACGNVVCRKTPDGCDGPCEEFMVAEALQSADEAEYIAALNPAVVLELLTLVRRLGETCHG